MERAPRLAGVSNAHSFKVIDLAFKGIFTHFYKPLKLITFLEIFLSAFSTLALISLSIIWFTKGLLFAGFGTLVSII